MMSQEADAENNDLDPDAEPRVSYRSCVAVFVVMLIIAILPILACRLATAGQMAFGTLPNNYLNIFLLQEAGQEGLGIQRTRRVEIPGNDNQGSSCIRTSVRYYMLSGEGENLDTCLCDAGSNGENLPSGCQVQNEASDQ